MKESFRDKVAVLCADWHKAQADDLRKRAETAANEDRAALLAMAIEHEAWKPREA